MRRKKHCLPDMRACSLFSVGEKALKPCLQSHAGEYAGTSLAEEIDPWTIQKTGRTKKGVSRTDTVLNWTSGEHAFLSTDEPGLRATLLKQAEKHPEAVKIIARPETNGGVLYLRIPVQDARWALRKIIRVRKPVDEEKKQELAERLKAARAKRGSV